MKQQQQQQYYENMGSIRVDSGGDLKIQQRIKCSLPLIIRILAIVQGILSFVIFTMEIGIITLLFPLCFSNNIRLACGLCWLIDICWYYNGYSHLFFIYIT